MIFKDKTINRVDWIIKMEPNRGKEIEQKKIKWIIDTKVIRLRNLQGINGEKGRKMIIKSFY